MADSHADKKAKKEPFRLIYWPGLPGRGEPIRLILEEAGAEYTDSALEEDGIKELQSVISPKYHDEDGNLPPFAPPALRDGDLLISQSGLIASYLGEKLGLAGPDERSRIQCRQLVLTCLDLQDEAHDTHHPIATGDYYEQQKPEALKRAADFRKNRVPKYLGYLDRVIAQSGDGPFLLASFTYADLVLYFVVSGLLFAFPRGTSKALKKYPRVVALHSAVGSRERIKAYEASERKHEFCEFGVYRHYPELDG